MSFLRPLRCLARMLSRKEEQQKGIYIIVSVTQKLLVSFIQMWQYNNNRSLILSFNFWLQNDPARYFVPFAISWLL